MVSSAPAAAMASDASGTMLLDEVKGYVTSLKNKMEARTSIVKQWCEERKEAVMVKESDAMQRLEELKTRMVSLKERRSELESQGYANGIRLESEREKVEDLRMDVGALCEQEAALENDIIAANTATAAVQNKIAVAARKMDEANNAHSHRLTELTQGARLFKKLGLTFCSMPQNCLKVVFSQIDPEDPEREFFVVVLVSSEDEYIVNKAQPQFPGLDELIKKVNVDNDFSAFVQDVRKRFVALARST